MKVIFKNLLILICLIYYNHISAYDFVDNGIAYTITSFSNLECEVVAYDSPYRGSVNIPSMVQYNGKEITVVSIGSFAFINNSELESIIIPGSVISIGDGAFKGCTGLSSVTIGDGCQVIGSNAFENCSTLPSISLPNSINQIGTSAFKNCRKVNEIEVPETVTIIKNSTFENCIELSSANILGVHEIGNKAFLNCESLLNLNIGKEIKTIGSQAFENCINLSQITLSNVLKSIGSRAFYGCTKLFEFIIPDTVTTIGDDAIGSCDNILLISIGEGINAIDYKLWGCSKVETLEIRESSKILQINTNINSKVLVDRQSYGSNYSVEIRNGIFSFLEITNLIINRPLEYEAYKRSSSDGRITLYLSPFSHNETIQNIVIGGSDATVPIRTTDDMYHNTHIYIGDLSFANCKNLKKVSIVGENISIPYLAQTLRFKFNPPSSPYEKYKLTGFSNCENLSEVILDIKATEEYAFYNCTNLIDLNISVNTIYTDSFLDCSNIENLTLNKTKFISNDAFNGCNSIKNINLPTTIEELNSSIISCPLQTLTINRLDPPLSESFPNSIYLNTILYIPFGSIKSYLESEPWKNFWNIEEMPAIKAESIIINIDKADLYICESVQLEATILPENTSDKTVKWQSSNDDVATVNESGLVTGLSEGIAIITASCGDVSATCEVTVVKPIIDAEKVILNINEASLNIDDTIQLEVTVLPEDTTDSTVTWNSSNDTVATVTKDGLVTAISKGLATITATCGNVNAKCTITVLEDAGVESLLANPDSMISIYSTDGILIRKDCKAEDLKSLAKGIYIMVSGKDRYKISI